MVAILKQKTQFALEDRLKAQRHIESVSWSGDLDIYILLFIVAIFKPKHKHYAWALALVAAAQHNPHTTPLPPYK